MSKHKKINDGSWERTIQKNAPTADTANQYISSLKHFYAWIAENNLPLRVSEMTKHEYIQYYIYDKIEDDYSPASIKKDLAALTCGRNERMSDYVRPRLNIGEGHKGRDCETPITYKEDRIFQIAPLIGCRRSEYCRLKQEDLIERDSRLFVSVKKGKGGKSTEYLVEKEHECAVKSFFDDVRGKDGYILSKDECSRTLHMNLHACRRERVQDLYERFVNAPEKEKNFMRREIKHRFDGNEKKKELYEREMRKIRNSPVYHVRGSIRKDMQTNGKALSYDREALLYASVMTAHYRTDVIVAYYMR